MTSRCAHCHRIPAKGVIPCYGCLSIALCPECLVRHVSEGHEDEATDVLAVKRCQPRVVTGRAVAWALLLKPSSGQDLENIDNWFTMAVSFDYQEIIAWHEPEAGRVALSFSMIKIKNPAAK